MKNNEPAYYVFATRTDIPGMTQTYQTASLSEADSTAWAFSLRGSEAQVLDHTGRTVSAWHTGEALPIDECYIDWASMYHELFTAPTGA
jgi:hypothetical protein